MPLNTQIIRNDEELKLKWTSFHVAAMVIAAAMDSGKGPYEDNSPMGIVGSEEYNGEVIGVSGKDAFVLMNYYVIATTPLNHGSYVLKNDYTFGDRMDGEILELKAGDKLVAYRD
jgi:hypothetical protein